MTVLRNKHKKSSRTVPAAISMGMHVSDRRKRPLHILFRMLIAAAGIFGTVFSFISASLGEGFYHFSLGRAALFCIIGFVYYSAAFALFGYNRTVSRGMTLTGVGGTLLAALFNIEKLIYGYKYTANMFMSAMYSKYGDDPLYELPEHMLNGNGDRVYPDDCAELLMALLILLIAAMVCRGTVKRPNALLVFGATFPLVEVVLFFGLVPDYTAFGALLCCWCASVAAEISEYSTFEDKSAEPLFNRNSVQSAFAAFITMAVCFTGAELCTRGYERSEGLVRFRNDIAVYMSTFSWEQFATDLKDLLLPPTSRSVTHDGKLGNVDKVEFSGDEMLELTVPISTRQMYLKGFTAVDYNGASWTAGPETPELRTALTSSEFLTGRIIKYIPEYYDLQSYDVVVRSTGVSQRVKYYPSNSAGLLESDGGRRRFGVYLPTPDTLAQTIMTEASSISLPDDLEYDEMRMREYAYKYCLDVPVTFDCAEEFFEDFSGSGIMEELSYIRTHLAEECEYTLNTGKKPFAADFARWFLTERKKGSCTHFASAAVLLCRYRGIPARYCEGFIVKSDDIADGIRSGSFITVSVPDSRAHAWVEVYIDGYGWTIFESTPGYGNVAFMGDISEEAVSEITEVTTQAPEFTENMISATTPPVTEAEDDGSGEISTEETTSVQADPDEEITTTEATAIPDEDEEDTSETTEVNDDIVPDMTDQFADIGGAGDWDGSFSDDGTAEGGNSGDGNGDNYNGDSADIGSPDYAEGDIPPDNGNNSGSDNDGGNNGNDSDDDNGGSGDSFSDSRDDDEDEGISEETARIILTVLMIILISAAMVGLILLRRILILSHRRRLIRNAPDRATVALWRVLSRLATRKGIKGAIPCEAAADVLSTLGFDRNCVYVISHNALKSRFGGGVTSDEAAYGSSCYDMLLTTYGNDQSGIKRIAEKYIYVSDKFC